MKINQAKRAALNFTLKVASPCNLNCSYCYVYNKADNTWKSRPPLMSDEIYLKTISRIKEHLEQSSQSSVEITFHGGEPCLIGPDRFGRWCATALSELNELAGVSLSIQTNGTLINKNWASVLKRHNVAVGVSIDGPSWVHDKLRVDKSGRGSHARVVLGVNQLAEQGLNVGALAVIQPGEDGLAIHNHLLGLGFGSINYLLPHFSHDEMDEVWRVHGPNPCSDFLLPILEDWWLNGSTDQKVVIFMQMARVVMGGKSRVDMFGNCLLPFVFVETDGSIGGLDTLRVGANRLAETGLSVQSNNFLDIQTSSDLHRKIIFDGISPPKSCEACQEFETCRGGHLADRYSSSDGFDNASIWCNDLKILFRRMRELLSVTPSETLQRRELLSDYRRIG